MWWLGYKMSSNSGMTYILIVSASLTACMVSFKCLKDLTHQLDASTQGLHSETLTVVTSSPRHFHLRTNVRSGVGWNSFHVFSFRRLAAPTSGKIGVSGNLIWIQTLTCKWSNVRVVFWRPDGSLSRCQLKTFLLQVSETPQSICLNSDRYDIHFSLAAWLASMLVTSLAVGLFSNRSCHTYDSEHFQSQGLIWLKE